MKTLQELYEEVKANDDLKKALAEAEKSGKTTEFLKAHDCDATIDELKEFVAEKAAHDKPLELGDGELENVAGGICSFTDANCNTDDCNKVCYWLSAIVI